MKYVKNNINCINKIKHIIMNKLLILILLVVLLCSCSGNPDDSGQFSCYVFEKTTITRIVEGVSIPGYPIRSVSEIEECDLTEIDANKMEKSLQSKTKQTVGSITFETETTVTKRKK